MAAVAERAGVSRRAVYLHFTSRTELVTELFGYVSEQEGLAASLQPVWDAPDAAALQAWAGHLARFHPRILAVARAIQQVRRSDPDAARHWRLVVADQPACCDRLARWLAREQRLARPWTVPAAADMLWALMSFELWRSCWSTAAGRPRATAPTWPRCWPGPSSTPDRPGCRYRNRGRWRQAKPAPRRRFSPTAIQPSALNGPNQRAM